MPLVELIYYDDEDCESGCPFAVDEVHSVGNVVESAVEAAGGNWSQSGTDAAA
eukprot:COSAG02_NODE_74566_length_156_cov_1763.578947_1_plen_52_part_11